MACMWWNEFIAVSYDIIHVELIISFTIVLQWQEILAYYLRKYHFNSLSRFVPSWCQRSPCLTSDDKGQLQQITDITDHLQTSHREPANMYPNRFVSLIVWHSGLMECLEIFNLKCDLADFSWTFAGVLAEIWIQQTFPPSLICGENTIPH